MDLFDRRNISPMLIAREEAPYENHEYLYEFKWDGERCVSYLEPKKQTDMRNKRNIKLLPKFPELSFICNQVKKKCILDGEVTIFKNGKPDFFEVQRRSILTDLFKIKLHSQQYPASYIVFDILYYENKSTMFLPLEERKELLQNVVSECSQFALSRTYESNALQLFDLAKREQLEGIVAKRRESIYVPGRKTPNWVKMKVMLEDDYIICGYILKSGSLASIVLGQYRQGQLVYKGHVTIGMTNVFFQEILKLSKTDAPMAYPAGHGNEEAVWVKPSLVCTVKFMSYTRSGGLRQPGFKGIRFDKLPKDCIDKES